MRREEKGCMGRMDMGKGVRKRKGKGSRETDSINHTKSRGKGRIEMIRMRRIRVK